MREGEAEDLGGLIEPGDLSHSQTFVAVLVPSALVVLVPDTLLRLTLTWTPALKSSLLPEGVGILQEGLGHRQFRLQPFAGQGW